MVGGGFGRKSFVDSDTEIFRTFLLRVGRESLHREIRKKGKKKGLPRRNVDSINGNNETESNFEFP